jgi:hypothetical protein
MSNDEQRQRVMAWAAQWQDQGDYATKPNRLQLDEIAAVLLAHLDGTKAGWSEVLGILNDGYTPNGNTREQLAEYAHEAWSAVIKSTFKAIPAVPITSIAEVQRRKRLANTPYVELSEEEKNKDRTEADKMLAIINGSTPREADEQPERWNATGYRARITYLEQQREQLSQRVAELEAQGHADYWARDREAYEAQIARLREAFQKIYDNAHPMTSMWSIAKEALSGASDEKGAEDAVVYTDTQCADVPSDGGVAQEVDSQKSRADADTPSEQAESSPTTLSAPLELEMRVPLDGTESDSNVETAMSVDDDRQWCNFVRIEKRDAEIVAAIAEVREWQKMDEARDLKAAKELATWLIERDKEHGKMQGQIDSLWERTDIYVDLQEKLREQIDSLSARCRTLENEDQNQHDSLVDHGHAIDQHREQIDALEKRIDFHAVNNPLNGNPDDISLHELISVVDQRCALIEQVLGGMTEEATFEKIDKLTEAVLMLLDEHRAEKQGMVMWGSGNFERMANKLRGKGESDG